MTTAWPRNDLRKQAFKAFLLQNSSLFADVSICCGDGKVLRVHKIVLAASSKFLENIFQQNNPVSEDDFTIILPDFHLETVEQFFDLVYKGECVPGGCLEDDLVKVATALGIDQIKGKSELVDEEVKLTYDKENSKVRC